MEISSEINGFPVSNNQFQRRRQLWAIENPALYKEWQERKNEKLKREREREIERERKERNVITNYFRKTI